MTTVNNSTLLVKLGEDGAPSSYPLSMTNVRQDNPDWSFVEENEEADINALGYFIVNKTTQPSGDVVDEGTPAFIDGQWTQTWEVRQYSPAEKTALLSTLKTETLDAIAERLASALELGFEFNFGTDETPDTGHVQLRDYDRANITGCGLKADRLVVKGVTDPVMPFRVYENVTKMCTPAQMKTLSDQAYDAYLVFLNLAWQLKDATTNAVDTSEVPAVPVILELPEGWETLLVAA